MSDHEGRGHHRDHATHRQQASGWRVHRDWRVWAAVGLMLLGMALYVLTQEEAVPPGGAAQPPVPAAP